MPQQIDKAAERRWRQNIRDVLNRDWDPIGVARISPDEYEGYAGVVAAMLRRQTGIDELVNYLRSVETEHMGLPGSFDSARAEKVIKAITALRMP